MAAAWGLHRFFRTLCSRFIYAAEMERRMSRAKKEKYLLYFVLMIVLIAGASFQHFVSNGKVDRCLDAGYEYDFEQKICLN